MDDMAQGPFSNKELWRAVVLSAVLGWAAVTVWALWGLPATQFLGLTIHAAILGLPVAFAGCALVGRPVLRRMMQRPIGWRRAASGGAVIATSLGALGILVGRLNGYRQSIDDSSYSQIGGGDYVRSVDGILTSYGWRMLAQNTAIFIALGVAIGLVVRAVIGPGKTPDESAVVQSPQSGDPPVAHQG